MTHQLNQDIQFNFLQMFLIQLRQCAGRVELVLVMLPQHSQQIQAEQTLSGEHAVASRRNTVESALAFVFLQLYH